MSAAKTFGQYFECMANYTKKGKMTKSTCKADKRRLEVYLRKANFYLVKRENILPCFAKF
jgi:endonuclease III